MTPAPAGWGLTVNLPVNTLAWEERFARVLGYRFADNELLTRALTHRSTGQPHNERLEFLGDALLGFIVAETLFKRYAEADEGLLTRLRAALVKRETLARIARELDLGAYLRLGEGELKSGGYRRDSILANGLEALIGAIFIDGGLDACRERVGNLFAGAYANLSPGSASKDPKTRLQEYLQARRLPLPAYNTVKVEGAPHEQSFTVECTLHGLAQPVSGHGSSRRLAEQQAAARALALLSSGGDSRP